VVAGGKLNSAESNLSLALLLWFQKEGRGLHKPQRNENITRKGSTGRAEVPQFEIEGVRSKKGGGRKGGRGVALEEGNLFTLLF